MLGLASAEETAEIEELRLQHPELNQAIESFSVMFENEALQNAITPPAYVKQNIMSAIKKDEIKTAQPSISPIDTNHANSSQSESGQVKTLKLWRMVAAASLILLITSAASNAYLYSRYKQKNEAYLALLTERNTLQANNRVYQTRYQEWESAKKMMADPAMAMIKMNGVAGKENSMATVFWNTKSKDVFIMPNNLPQPAHGKQYQLWALVDGKPVDAGVLDPYCTGACKMKNIPKANGFAITLEKEGGSPTPTLEAMYVKGNV